MEHFQIHSDSVSIGKMRYFASNKFSYGQRNDNGVGEIRQY